MVRLVDPTIAGSLLEGRLNHPSQIPQEKAAVYATSATRHRKSALRHKVRLAVESDEDVAHAARRRAHPT